MDALEVHLARGEKVLKEATKAQSKLLTRGGKAEDGSRKEPPH